MSKKILKFGATWCSSCKGLSMTINNSKLDIPVEEIDIDENPDMVDKYNIRGVPTMVLVNNGEEVRRLVGNATPDNLKKFAE